ncbi:putative GMC-type oxidoreductase [Rhizocola hellebori]|uniref:Putative GMC-type oxidoreductase n=1 Tax=Rhizocola hellebori TaxID=1392758 RepID=A0A8J3VJY0_9ACTN|nr:GMC family oxidoreductase N-terminal domain-containing protein [Rhizocola hellebori]GIH08443.1 putative GMC-type oxidoreductase [Rhizocola hellebori]
MSEQRFDYVIVGAGAAGCVLAHRLSADPAVRVALLEAGGPDKAQEIRIPAAFSKLFTTAYDWNYRTSKQSGLGDRELYWPRGKTLGGSTSINAQMWLRGQRADYDGWGCAGWSYDELLPYFNRAESHPMWISPLRTPHALTMAFLDACAEEGLPQEGSINGATHAGYGLTPVTQRRGRRWSAADAYLRSARRRPNLTVLTGALVERVDLVGDRATGVTYRDASGAVHQIAAGREVILSAGAVNSPQLLMLSGIGEGEQLSALGITPRHEVPAVGLHLQDHLASGIGVHCPVPITMVAAESPRQVLRYLLARKGMLSSNVAEGIAFIRSDKSLAAPDLELIFAPVPFIEHGQTAPPGHGITIGVVLLQPESEGRITLSSADPAEPPVIDPGYLSAQADVRRLVAGLKVAHRLLQTRPLRPFAGAPMEPWTGNVDDDSLAAHVRERAETLYHPVGTCRMGTSDDTVVGLDLKVHGVQGLRVADASVMPRINRGHTQAPAYMIGEKAADLISG